MSNKFNPNELLLERIRTVEEYDPATGELLGRYTQIENPSLQTTANATEVVDAMGVPIATFYNAQQGTFTFTNSLFSMDLAASQFGDTKEIADDENKITVPVTEILTIGNDGKVVLKYTPVGVAGAEIKYVKVINENNTFGATYEISPTLGNGKFTLDVENKTITLPEGTTGNVFVKYERESTRAARVSKYADSLPDVRSLLVHAIFHDPCNKNIVYAGVIYIPRAEIDIANVDINLTSDGKHGATYKLVPPYCTGNQRPKLFDIIVTED